MDCTPSAWNSVLGKALRPPPLEPSCDSWRLSRSRRTSSKLTTSTTRSNGTVVGTHQCCKPASSSPTQGMEARCELDGAQCSALSPAYRCRKTWCTYHTSPSLPKGNPAGKDRRGNAQYLGRCRCTADHHADRAPAAECGSCCLLHKCHCNPARRSTATICSPPSRPGHNIRSPPSCNCAASPCRAGAPGNDAVDLSDRDM